MNKPHIVILGSGFGGTYVAKKLVSYVKKGKIDVTIVNRTNYFLFTPLLHEVATGALSPTSVAEPLREIFANTGVRVVQGTVEFINRDKKLVKLIGHSRESTITYDQLVIATGAETNYYDIPGAEKFTYPLKSLLDAARIRSQVIDAFEQAILTDDVVERSRLLSFVVVGGGATGVETAAELAEFIHGMVERYYSSTKDCNPSDHRSCKPEEPFITLIHTGPEVLQMFAPKLRLAAEKRLQKSGVALQLNSTVTEVTNHGLKLSNGTVIPSSTIIWTAGVKPVVPHFEGAIPALIAGRFAVDEYFRVNSDPYIYAIGDVAGYVDRDTLTDDPTKTRPLPMLAQVAVGQSRTVAYNIIATLRDKPLRSFHYHSKGTMVSVGQWFALGEIFSLHVAGRLTWWIWRTIYLFKFASWKKRLRIAFEWTLELVYPRDITKLT
jgi:NADH:ubiquinone reductase (H+-translocating)